MLVSLLVAFTVSGLAADQPRSGECLDPALVGVWYRLTTRQPSHPFPIQLVDAFKVTEAGSLLRLGIEARTGRLADRLGEFERHAGTIECALDGTLVLRYLAVPTILVDTMEYRIRGDTLAVEGRPISGHYRRTELGAPVASPVAAEFFAVVDGVEQQNDAIATRVPTAQLRGSHGGRLVLWADVSVEDFSSAWIRVEIRRYRGPGSYPIGPGQGELAFVAGDAITLHATDSPGSGHISIRSCEPRGRRCSGEFEFVTGQASADAYPQRQRRIANGRFSVPIYP